MDEQRMLFDERSDLSEYWQRCNHCRKAWTIDEWMCLGFDEHELVCPKCLRHARIRWITDRPIPVGGE